MLTEAFLGTIVEAAFRYVLNDAAPRQKICSWLGRDTQHVAVQSALTHALATFADRYHAWVSSFFDQPFLVDRAAPLIVRCLAPIGPPDPRELAIAWAGRFGVQGLAREQHIAESMPTTSDFLRRLEADIAVQDPQFWSQPFPIPQSGS